MAYIGNDLQVAFPSYRIIDDISSGFNGSQTTFALTVGGATPVPFPINPQQCLISVNGVIQKPDPTGASGFNLVGSNIVFASAPTGGWSFFGVILAGADYVNVGANFPSGSAGAPSITFDSDTDTGIYNSGANQVSISTAGVERFRVDSAGQLEAVSLGSAASPTFSFTTDTNTGIYSPGADQLAISTNGTGRLFVDASGNVGIGTSSLTTGSGRTYLTLGGGTLGSIALKNASNSEVLYVQSGAASVDYYMSVAGYQAFWTNNSERLRITSAGLVGIGTSSPGQALQVVGSIGVNTGTAASTNGSGISIYDASFPRLTFRNSTTGDTTGDGTQLVQDGLNFNIGNTEAGEIKFFTSNTQRATIDSSGRVGIGSTAPSKAFVVSSGGAQGIELSPNDAGGGTNRIISYNRNTSAYTDLLIEGLSLQFQTNNGNERFRCDSSGRLLVGTSSARSNFYNDTNSSAIQIEGADNDKSALAIVQNFNSNTLGAQLILAKSNATSIGSNTLVANGDRCGVVSFQGNDGAQFVEAANIRVEVDGTPGANDMPGRLVFSTTADGASSPTERCRVDSSGRLLLGASSAIVSTTKFQVGTTSSTSNNVLLSNNGTESLILYFAQSGLGTKSITLTTNDRINIFSNHDTSTGVYLTSGGTSWTSTSDERLKEDLEPITDGLEKISDLRCVIGNYVNDPAKKRMPFLLAQDVEQVLPEAVDSTDPDELGLSYTAMIPLLVAALKESKERIETLEAKVAALEGA